MTIYYIIIIMLCIVYPYNDSKWRVPYFTIYSTINSPKSLGAGWPIYVSLWSMLVLPIAIPMFRQNYLLLTAIAKINNENELTRQNSNDKWANTYTRIPVFEFRAAVTAGWWQRGPK